MQVMPALAQTNLAALRPDDAGQSRSASATKVEAQPPSGFDGLDESVSTEFDVTFQERAIGSFRATFDNGQLLFADPAAVARALGPGVDTAAATAFLSRPLSANEQFRCRPGVMLGVGCGLLPGDASGIIANPEAFSVTLFLSRQYLVSAISGPRMLGPAMSGPSLIQTARFAVARDGNSGTSYGGTFDTLASLGQNALIAQTTLSDTEGLRAQQLYAQRIWSDRRAAAGLLQDFQSLIFTNYRVLGAELSSFYGTLLDATNDTATPLEILMPQRGQVEIYRNDVLITAARYEAGLQLLNTAALPEGAYTVRIVARDGARVMLDQTRAFSKISNLVPPGKTAFRFRAGARTEDNFLSVDGRGGPGFLPRTTGEVVLSASGQRRVGRSIAASATVTSFDSRVFGETSMQFFRGRFSGLAGVGVGSDGTYSALVSTNIQLPRISFYVSARTTQAPDNVLPIAIDDRYRAFFRSQDTVFGSVQTRVLGGSLGLSGSYTRSSDFPKRYAVGLQYNRSVDLPWAASALLSAGVTKSDFDTRVGFTISFFKRVDRKTTASFTGGGYYVGNSQPGTGGRKGFSPVGEAVLSRREQVGPVDLVAEAGVGTDVDGDRAFGRLRTQSTYGSADAAVQWQKRPFGDAATSYLFNGETGFAIGGGGAKIGMRDPAEAMVMLDLSDIRAPAREDAASTAGTGSGGTQNGNDGNQLAAGGYRITVDGRPYDYIEPGRRVALGLTAFREYQIGLKPEGAPQFDIDSTRRKVTLYPGNVVRMRFEAQRVISLFGQILLEDGSPAAQARIEAGTDYAVADDRGYFTVTAPLSSTIAIRRADGGACVERSIRSLIDAKTPSVLYRFGKIRCSTTGAMLSPTPQPEGKQLAQAPHEAELRRVRTAARSLADAPDAQPDREAPSSLSRLVAREFLRQLD